MLALPHLMHVVVDYLGSDKVVSDFNDGLKTLKENGKLAEIGKKWFGENVSDLR
jgi:ABC-type amino acid transport substrate-binding protein